MTSARLQIEDRERLRVLTLSNPAKRNALDDGLLEQLASALVPNASLRALLICGEGSAFCAGYDLDKLPSPSEGGVLPDDRLSEVLLQLERYPAPTVALVHGAAYGAGCDLASACDFRVGSPKTAFCMPPARLGIVYGREGIRRITSLVGRAFAKRMFFTGLVVRGEEAHRRGLLDLYAEEATHAAEELCRELVEAAPLAVAGMKETFLALEHGGEESRLRSLRRAAFLSQDASEGRAAFLEKRRPGFRGE